MMSRGPTVIASDQGTGEKGTVLNASVQPRCLGRFQLERLLGRGQMGEAWKAYDPTREDYVVVKILPSELQGNVRELDRVKRSFLCIQRLQHQHICPVYDLGEDAETGHYLVMKFLPFGTLDDYVAEYYRQYGPLPVEEAVRVLRPIAEALDYAHSQAVVHRDLKPANILVSGDGDDAQLIDFGLAAEIRTSLTRTTRTVLESPGTLAYMAPEQWRGRQVDGRADQYAFAVLIYELLAGRLPFESAETAILRQCVLEESVEAIPGLPLSVNTALARGLAKQPDDRFPSCVALLEAMQNERTGLASPLGSAKPLPEVLAIADPVVRVRAASELLTVLLRALMPSMTSGVDLRTLDTLLPRVLDSDAQQSFFLTVTHLELLNGLEVWQTLNQSDSATVLPDAETLSRLQSAWTRAINDLLPHAPVALSSAAGNSVHAQFPMSEAVAVLTQRVKTFAKVKYSHWQHLPQPERWRQAAIAAVAILCLGWGLPATYSWLSPERAAHTARIAAEKERTSALQAAADRKANTLFQPAETEFQTQGVRQYDAHDYRAARAAFERSQDGFRKARTLAEQMTTSEKARSEAQASHSAAGQVLASTRCPDKWREATQLLESADQRFTAALYPEAEKEFRQAQTLFESLKTEARQLGAAEDDATKALTAAKDSSREAEQAQAAKLCPTSWNNGQAKLTGASQSFAAKKFQLAYQQANEAKALLQGAARDSHNLARVRTDAEEARTVAGKKKADAENAKASLTLTDESDMRLFDDKQFASANAQLTQAESAWNRQDYSAARDGFRAAEASFQKVIAQADQLRPRTEAVAAKKAAETVRDAATKGSADKLAQVRQWQEGQVAWKEAENAFEAKEFVVAKQHFERSASLCQEASVLVNLLQEIDQAQTEIERLGVPEPFLNQHGGEIWSELKKLIAVVRTTSEFAEQQKAAEQVRRLLPKALNVGRVISLFKDKKHEEALDLLLTSWPDESDPNRRALFNSCAAFVPQWWWSQVEKLAADAKGRDEQFHVAITRALAAADVGHESYSGSLKLAYELAEQITNDSEFKFDGLMSLANAQKIIGDRAGLKRTLKQAEQTVDLLEIQPRQLAGWDYRELVSAKSLGFAQIAGLYRWLEDDAKAGNYELYAHQLLNTNYSKPNFYMNHANEHFRLYLMTDGAALPKRNSRPEELRLAEFRLYQAQYHRDDQIASYRNASALLARQAADVGLRSVYVTAKSSAENLNRAANQESVVLLFFRVHLADAALRMNDLDDAKTLVSQVEQAARNSFKQQTQLLPYVAQAARISQAILAEIHATRGTADEAMRALDTVECRPETTVNNHFWPVHRGLVSHCKVSALLAARDEADLSELYDRAKKRPTVATRVAALVGLAQAMEKRTTPSASPARLKLVSYNESTTLKKLKETIQEEEPVGVKLSPNAIANDHFREAEVASQQQNWQKAHDKCGLALQLVPNFKAALKLRAECHWKMGKVTSAMRDAKAAGWIPRVHLIKEATLKSDTTIIAKVPRGKWVEITDIEDSWLRVVRYLDANGDVQEPPHAWVQSDELFTTKPDLADDHAKAGANTGSDMREAPQPSGSSAQEKLERYQEAKPYLDRFVPGNYRRFIP